MEKEKIFELAQLLLPAFLERYKNELGDRKGIYLALKEKISSSPREMSGKLIGFIPHDKINEKMRYAFEKIDRLERRRIAGYNEVTSFESENATAGQFGGSILTNNYFMSGSGFPPHLDQKFITTLSLLVDEINYEQAKIIELVSAEQCKKWQLAA